MARFEDGSYGTAAGVALIAKVLAGRCKMEYTKAAVGNGYIPEDMTPKTMDGPAGYVMDAKISGVSNPVDGECQVSVQIHSKDVGTGFYATCIVLYANDPDDGEIPYTYLVLENEPEWIRPASAIVGKLATFDIIAAMGDVDAVSAVIDPEAIATVANVEQLVAAHNTDPEAHEDIRAQIAALDGKVSLSSAGFTIPADAWVLDEAAADRYVCCADVAVEGVSSGQYIETDLDRASGDLACEIGMAPDVSIPEEGVLRFFAQAAPGADLTGTCRIWTEGSAGTGGSGSAACGCATAGNGEVAEMLDEVFPEGSASGSDPSAGDGDVNEMLDEVFPE